MTTGSSVCIALLCLQLIAVHIAATFGSEQDCAYQDTCEGCLSASLTCAWCTDTGYAAAQRCSTQKQLLDLGCAKEHIYENEPKLMTLLDEPVKDYDRDVNKAVQVQPQKVFVKLVKSHPQRVRLTYRPARQNPLDLYFLMDLTWTMRDDRETLVQLGAELSEALRNLTTNYRLGFGSFADKPIMPMIAHSHHVNPCASQDAQCEPTYDFRHQLPLTDEMASFVRSVNRSRVTGNLDNLEGGFDGLMQVLACPEQIGWKREARKIVILVTDGFMHLAGDGVLAGITQPNDKQCRLSETGEYLGSLAYDYPSLEEIYRELLRRKVSVIFAVTADVVNTYAQMSGLLREISDVGILSADSSNILELIRKSYESFVQRTQFTDNSPDFIQVQYSTDCGGQYSTLLPHSSCNLLTIGEPVEFQIDLLLTELPDDGVYRRTIRIEEASLNEYMDIEVEIQPACSCAEPAAPDNMAARWPCYDNGYLHCGDCQCDDGWSGLHCTCSTSSLNVSITNEAMNNLCRKPFDGSSKLGAICSERGECECGQCACMNGFDGKYCECPDCDDCDPEHGDCVCGQCVCKAGWRGPQCECHDAVTNCVGPSGEICSKQGFCNCNECQCHAPYKGRFCEIADGVENKMCTFYSKCVKCVIEQKTGSGYCESLMSICSDAMERQPFAFSFVADIDADVRCLLRLKDSDGNMCDHYFTYLSVSPHENYLAILVNNCETLSMLVMSGGISFATIVIGLIVFCTIIWCMRLKDRREYARFKQEQSLSSLSEYSQLYKSPITKYDVPPQLADPFFDD